MLLAAAKAKSVPSPPTAGDLEMARTCKSETGGTGRDGTGGSEVLLEAGKPKSFPLPPTALCLMHGTRSVAPRGERSGILCEAGIDCLGGGAPWDPPGITPEHLGGGAPWEVRR